MPLLTPDERFDRLDDFIARGAILRRTWWKVEDGREYACLLAALSPEVVDTKNASACPADTIAPWFAHMLPRMDDRGSLEAWPAMIRRVAATVRRCHRWLQPEDWRRCDYAVRAAALREALPFASPETKPAIERVLALCDREALGDVVTESQWSEARAGAAAVSAAAAAAVRGVAYAAIYDDAAALRGVAYAAAAAALRGVAYAAAAADAAATADVAAVASAAAAAGAAAAWHGADAAAIWDRISAATLDILDAACAAREAQKI